MSHIDEKTDAKINSDSKIKRQQVDDLFDLAEKDKEEEPTRRNTQTIFQSNVTVKTEVSKILVGYFNENGDGGLD